MKGMIVYYYDGGREEWRFAYIVENKTVLRGFVCKMEAEEDGYTDVDAGGGLSSINEFMKTEKVKTSMMRWSNFVEILRQLMFDIVYMAFPKENEVTAFVEI